MVTGLVTPLIVRSPVRRKVLSSSCWAAVETKVISGNVSISRKSLLRRWASRCSLRVSMLSALTVTVTDDLLGSSPSSCAVPSNSLKAPRTLVTIACRATNPIRVCAGSRVYWPVSSVRAVGVVMACSSRNLDDVSCTCRGTYMMRHLFRYTGTMSGTRWLDETEQRAWRGYLRMQGRLSAQLNRQLQADSELSLADFDVLVHLTDVPDGRVRVLELARQLEWEQSRTSHQVARMQKRGLVVREECADDRRGAFVVLTPAGRAAIEAAAPRHVATVRRLVFDALSTEQVAALGAIAEQVDARLDDEDAC